MVARYNLCCYKDSSKYLAKSKQLTLLYVLLLVIVANMEYLSVVFENTEKIVNLVNKGYKVVAVGNDLNILMPWAKSLSACVADPEGTSSCRLYFVFYNSGMDKDERGIGCINADLDEYQRVFIPDNIEGVVLPTWNKMKVAVKYPFECYIYVPGNGVADSGCPEIVSSEYRDVVQEGDADLVINYINVDYSNRGVMTALLVPTKWNESQEMIDAKTEDKSMLTFYISDESLNFPMDADVKF